MNSLARVAVTALALVAAGVLGVTLAARGLTPLPDLVLILVAAAGLRSGPWAGVAVGLAGGWILDLVPPGSDLLGSTALVYAAAGLLVGLARRPGRVALGWLAIATAGASGLVEGGRVAHALLVGAPIAVGPVLARIALTATLAALLIPLIGRVLDLEGGRLR